MTKTGFKLALAALLICGFAAAGPVAAKQDFVPGAAAHGKGAHGKEGKKKHARSKGGRFKSSQRSAIFEYLKEQHGDTCPRGLAKKNNGCMPPGLAKKYRHGSILDASITWEDLPEELLRRIGLPRPGTRYVKVDNDVLLISEATKKILDAVVLTSGIE